MKCFGKGQQAVFPGAKRAALLISVGVVLAIGIPWVVGGFRVAIPATNSLVEHIDSEGHIALPALLMDVNLAAYQYVPSASFTQEVFDLGGMGDVYADASSSIVGFFIAMPGSAAASWAETEMGKKGWVEVDSGREEVLSFVKDTGVYRGCTVQVYDMVDESAVVVQLISQQ